MCLVFVRCTPSNSSIYLDDRSSTGHVKLACVVSRQRRSSFVIKIVAKDLNAGSGYDREQKLMSWLFRTFVRRLRSGPLARKAKRFLGVLSIRFHFSDINSFVWLESSRLRDVTSSRRTGVRTLQHRGTQHLHVPLLCLMKPYVLRSVFGKFLYVKGP